MSDSTYLESMKVDELKDELREQGEKVTGNKDELIERLNGLDTHHASGYDNMTVVELKEQLRQRHEKVSGNRDELLARVKGFESNNDDGADQQEGGSLEDMTVEQLRDELRQRCEKVGGTKAELIDRLRNIDTERTSGYERMTVDELKEELRQRGDKVSGNKAELIDRLEGGDAGTNDEAAVGDKRKADDGAGSLEDMTVEQLRDELRQRGEKVGGTKDELIARLAGREEGSESPRKRTRSESEAEPTRDETGRGQAGDELEGMTVKELKDELRERGEKVTGNKDELIDRLAAADEEGGAKRKQGDEQGRQAEGGGSFEDMTVEQLKDVLRERGETVSGNRDELIERLASAGEPSKKRARSDEAAESANHDSADARREVTSSGQK